MFSDNDNAVSSAAAKDTDSMIRQGGVEQDESLIDGSSVKPESAFRDNERPMDSSNTGTRKQKRHKRVKSNSAPSGLLFAATHIGRKKRQQDGDSNNPKTARRHSLFRSKAPPPPPIDTVNMATLEQLGNDFTVSQKEHEVEFQAQVKSTSQCLVVALSFLVIVEVIGVVVCMKKGGYQLNQALLFTHYTMTTSGYGNYPIPDDTGYQIFLCFLMLAGIASITIAVSQVYQYIALGRLRAEHSVLKTNLASAAETTNGAPSGRSYLASRGPQLVDKTPTERKRIYRLDRQYARGFKKERKVKNRISSPSEMLDRAFGAFDLFLVKSSTPIGRFLSVLIYLGGLLLVGALGIMWLEGQTFVQGLYLATYTMTTVGYGDIPVTKDGTIWFCVFWLPLNVSFLSIYMGNLVRVYAVVAHWNIDRIRIKIRAELDQGKRHDRTMRNLTNLVTQKLRRRNPATGGDGDHAMTEQEKQLENEKTLSRVSIKTMKDVIGFVRTNLTMSDKSPLLHRLLRVKSCNVSSLPFAENGARNPSFVLQVLVQERLAQIIATEIAGYQSDIYIRADTASLTVETLTATANKWCVPALARDAFVTVAFEALLYVGEHRLVTEGADSIFALTPVEFHELCLPFLAALGDAGTMEGWMARTEPLFREYLSQSC